MYLLKFGKNKITTDLPSAKDTPILVRWVGLFSFHLFLMLRHLAQEKWMQMLVLYWVSTPFYLFVVVWCQISELLLLVSTPFCFPSLVWKQVLVLSSFEFVQFLSGPASSLFFCFLDEAIHQLMQTLRQWRTDVAIGRLTGGPQGQLACRWGRLALHVSGTCPPSVENPLVFSETFWSCPPCGIS